MLPGQKRKPNYVGGLILLVVASYLGYTLGQMVHFRKLFVQDWGQQFLYYLLRPFPIIWNSQTKTGAFIGAIVAAMIWMYYTASIRNRLTGKEYGSARFEDPSVVTKKYMVKGICGKILGKDLELSTNDRHTSLNNNVLVIGGSGAGKSFRFVKPNILRCNGSMLITDPKGELLRDTGKYLEQHGYRVLSLNLVDMSRSHHYNPLHYLRTFGDVTKLVDVILKNTTPKDARSTDPFWEHAEQLFLQALLFYVWLAPEMEGGRNLASVIALMREASASENEKVRSRLDKRMDALSEKEWSFKNPVTGEANQYRGIDHPAYKAYRMLMSGAVDTLRSVFVSLNARLGFLINNPELLKILADDEINIPSIGMGYGADKQLTALFCVIPDTDRTNNAVVGMLYSQIFQELYYQADNNTDSGRLPVDLSCWFDEFVNVAMPADFCSLLSTMRSRGISANIIIQNLAQIKEKYEKSWETIPGNCDALVYLGGNEQSTHKYISEMLGKWTIDKRSTSSSTGKNGSTSRSDDIIGRELMTPDEVRMMPNHKEIVLIRGEYPVLCNKYRTEKDPVFIEAKKCDAYVHEARNNERNETYSYMENDASADVQATVDGKQLAKDVRTIITSFAQLRELERKEKETPYEITLAADTAASAGAEKGMLSEAETIKSRMVQFDFTDDQLQEAVLASADGLSEAQILEWFRPENSAKKMELARTMQLQERYKDRKRKSLSG